MAPVCRDEEGFILITALWLLLLCGAIVGLMMLRNAGRVEQSRAQSKEVQARLDLDAAVETIAADLIIRGPTSPWGQLPAAGTLSIDGSEIGVQVSSDHGRLDLISTDLTTIDRALQGLGVRGAARSDFVGALRLLRESNTLGPADKRNLFARLGPVPCPSRWFTLFSGLSQPDDSQLGEELAHAMGMTRIEGSERQPIKAGTPLRLSILQPEARKITVILRISGAKGTFDVLEWNRAGSC